MENFQIKDNTILIVPNLSKNKILKELSTQELSNIKVFSIQELQKKYYFDYDNKAIYYLMTQYHYSYDVAKMYLSHLYEVGQDDFGEPKIKKIIALKEELIANQLLYQTKNFKNFLENKNIIVYDSKFFQKKKKASKTIRKAQSSLLLYHEPTTILAKLYLGI